jgi:hypothetical protein
MRTLFLAAWCSLIGMYVFGAPGVVFAQCSSANVGLDIAFQQQSVTLMFVGRPARVEHAGSTETVVFDVERVWKSDVKERTMIHRPAPLTSQTPESAVRFDRGQRYVVVAHRSMPERRDLGIEDGEEAFGTDACGDGSRPVSAVERISAG